MSSTKKLIEKANEWLAERGQNPLTSQEIVYLIGRISTVLDSAKSPEELREGIAVSIAKVVCDLRGYEVPSYDEIKNYLDITRKLDQL